MLRRSILLVLALATVAIGGSLGGARAQGGIQPAQLVPPPPQPGMGQPRTPRPGDFLIANRRLDDANFAETVVLLLHAGGPEGAQGVVVNRRTPVRVAAALPGISAFADRPDTLYWGGPVEPQSAVLLVRAEQPPPSSAPIVEGVFVVRTREGIEAALSGTELAPAVRVFSGYAGWTSGQLEWELSIGSWYLRRADADDIFAADVDDLWKTLSVLASAPIA
jgi:putative transcriptional regulator